MISRFNTLITTEDFWISGTQHEEQIGVRCYMEHPKNLSRMGVAFLIEKTETEHY